MHKPLALALVLLLAATPIFSQSSARSSSAVQVTLVEVPVNVYDHAGNAIRGLTAADFELTDDGKKREITHFEEIDLAQLAAQKQTPSSAARRNFMLLFDLSNSTPTSIGRSRDAALQFVKGDLTEADVFWCTADVGWVTGHSYVVYGPLALGVTEVMYEGAPDHPGKDRFWSI